MEERENVGIIRNRGSDESIGGICTSNGFAVWSCKRRNAKRELKKRMQSCRIIVFEVDDEDEYTKEAKKRHALIEDIHALDRRIEVVCVIKESLCASGVCKMGCTKMTCKEKNFSMLRHEFEKVFRRTELKCW